MTLIGLAFLAWACQPEPVPDSLSLSTPAQVSVPVEGDVVSISFNSSVPWTATTDAAWLTISPASGEAGDATIKASALKNESNDSRSAIVSIKAGTESAFVTVTQAQTDAVVVATKEFTVTCDGGEISVPVSANVDFQVEIPEAVDWVHFVGTKAMTDSKVVLKVDGTHMYEFEEDWSIDPNKVVRSANITIKSGSIKEVVKVNQTSFSPYFEYTGDWAGLQWSFYEGVPTPIPQEGADITIPVATNLDWRVYFSVWDNDQGAMVDTWDTEWAHLSFDVEKAEIHLVIDPNDTFFSRDEYLYAECFIDGVTDASFGGLGQLRQAGKDVQGASASLVWTKTLGELGIPAGYNRLAYKKANGDALILSDGEKVHAISPADGTYWKAITWTNVKPTSICSDDAGNVIVAETQPCATGMTYKVYYAENVNEDPVELFSHTNDFDGSEIGGWRVRGDISKSAIVTGIITMGSGPAYWGGWEIVGRQVSYDNYYVQGTNGQNRGPLTGDGLGSPVYGAVISLGPTAGDGIFYRGYDGLRNVYYLASATYPNWVTPYDWQLVAEGGNSGNVNQNNLAIAEINGKRILAYTQGFHFNYSFDQGFITVIDVTTPGDFKTLLSIPAEEYLDFDAPCLWQSSADVLLNPTESGLELYVVNSGLGVLAKFLVTIE